MKCPTDASGQPQCVAYMKTMLALASNNIGVGENIDVVMTTEKPLINNYWVRHFTCQHGNDYWMEPTSDQLLAWRLRESGRVQFKTCYCGATVRPLYRPDVIPSVGDDTTLVCGHNPARCDFRMVF